MDKIYKIKKIDGTVCTMTYQELCHTLGFIPEVSFVRVTSQQTIGFTVGKPDEAKALLAACKRVGFVASEKLADAARR